MMFACYDSQFIVDKVNGHGWIFFHPFRGAAFLDNSKRVEKQLSLFALEETHDASMGLVLFIHICHKISTRCISKYSIHGCYGKYGVSFQTLFSCFFHIKGGSKLIDSCWSQNFDVIATSHDTKIYILSLQKAIANNNLSPKSSLV